MNKRRLLNLPRTSQNELCRQFLWLKALIEDERPDHVQVLSVSVFDHWLSREEACELLEDVPPFEQKRRDALHADFCKALVTATFALSFTFRGRKDNRLIFRKFTSETALVNYCTPHGARTLKHRQFQIALPDLDCVFLESWDDTNHIFFTETTAIPLVQRLARENGLYVLSRG